MPVIPSDEYITSLESVPRGISNCADPGAYEAATSGDEVVISAKWSTSCTGSYDLEIRLSHDGIDPVAAQSRLVTIVDGEPLAPDTAISIEIAEFDPAGVISGRWADKPFWVVVDRPTLVPLTDGMGELARGQVSVVNGCFIQNVEASEASIAATLRTFGTCDGVAVAVTDLAVAPLGSVATVVVS